MMKKIIFVIFAVALAAPLSVFANGKTEEGADKVYKFATDATWPPMEYIDENGDIVGFDMDMLAAIAQAAGFRYEVQNSGWDGIFAGLANGAYDAVISSVTITEERRNTMDFTQPYINAGQILMTPAAYSGGESLSDFAGKKVGVQQGTTGDFAVEEAGNIDRRAYDDIGLAIEDMINGNIDAIVCDSITAVDFVVTNDNFTGKLKIIGEPFTEEHFGIAVRQGDEELLAILNSGLDAIIADGTQDKLVEKWLR